MLSAPRLAPVRPSPFRILRHVLALVACSLVMAKTSAWSADGSVNTLAEREVQRRLQLVATAGDRLVQADQLAREGKLADALVIYQDTYESLPNVPMASEVRLAARTGYTSTACVRAQELMVEGRRDEAVKLLDAVTGKDVDPDNSAARRLRKQLDDPDRWPPALTAQHVSNVVVVKDLLLKAHSAYEIGDYDKSRELYQDVLRIDPYNSAARRGMEKAEAEKARYFDAARDQNRAQMLNQVNQTWEDQVPLSAKDVSSLFGAGLDAPSEAVKTTKAGKVVIVQKLRNIIIPKIEFSGASLEEVMEYLKVRTRDLDPTGKGVDFVIDAGPEARARPVNVRLNAVPVEEVLRYVMDITGMAYKVDEFAVKLVSLSEASQTITTRQWRVPPDFIQTASIGDSAAPASPDPFAAAAAAATPTTTLGFKRLGAREFLESRGISFTEGSSASYSAYNNTLTVRNTAKNLDLVNDLVEQSTSTVAKQVQITVRIVEIGQVSLKELGFDWLIGNLGLGQSAFLGGGSVGNSLTNPDFPNPTTGLNPITSGLRTGNAAVPLSSIDSLLVGSNLAGIGGGPGVSNVAPGFLSVSGALTHPQFQTVIRGLNQKKGTDVISAPSVTSKSGQKVSIEVTREMPYPTEFDPPQLPQASNVVFIILNPPNPPIILPNPVPAIVTPTTPTAFEVRKTGIVLEVEPVISEDGRTVDLTLTPSNTDFQGFVNYGSPIFDPTGVVGNNMLVDNRILQPIFKVQKIATGVKIYDGATVVIGGLMQDQENVIEDRIPVLGELPGVGKLFQSSVKKKEPKNLIFFVTVKVMDPSGQPIARNTAAVQQ